MILFIVGLSWQFNHVNKPIHFGQFIRILGPHSNHFLHSSGIQYNSGSSQQVVTGLYKDYDDGSLWVIKPQFGVPQHPITKQVQCGSVVRLEHCLTKKNLHANPTQSPISSQYEVTGYQEGDRGDANDNWMIECEGMLTTSTSFHLRHQSTGRYLRLDARFRFNQQNCGFQCAIMNELEASAIFAKQPSTRLVVKSGLFLTKAEATRKMQNEDL